MRNLKRFFALMLTLAMVYSCMSMAMATELEDNSANAVALTSANSDNALLPASVRSIIYLDGAKFGTATSVGANGFSATFTIPYNFEQGAYRWYANFQNNGGYYHIQFFAEN